MSVILRIFSGPHLGAEIELTSGIYVIGTDDSCDLILSDGSLAARHAALRVTGEGHESRVSAEALDGTVLLNGASLTEESELPPALPFQLGLLAAAWLPGDTEELASAWAEVAARLQEKTKVSDAGATAPSPADTVPPAQENAPGGTPPADEAPLRMDEGSSDDAEEPRKPRRGRDLGIIAAIVLAGALCFSWNASPEPAPEATVRQLLDEAGYRTLKVSSGRDSVTVTGRIASDRERGRLLRLAQLLPFPVYLDVTVRSDVADAVRASFNTLALWPEVTELPPSGRPGVRVRGYIRDGVLEHQALSNALRNVPELRKPENGGKAPLEIFRTIKHEKDVQAVLGPALSHASLQDVQCIFHPGRVVLYGPLTPQKKDALEAIACAVEAQLGVPIPFDIVNEADVQTQKTNIYVDQRSPDSRRAAKSSAMDEKAFRIVSVSMGAMKFVTLENGERVFEGGELPGGYVLDHIDVDNLTLTKNGATTLYPLRDDHE